MKRLTEHMERVAEHMERLEELTERLAEHMKRVEEYTKRHGEHTDRVAEPTERHDEYTKRLGDYLKWIEERCGRLAALERRVITGGRARNSSLSLGKPCSKESLRLSRRRGRCPSQFSARCEVAGPVTTSRFERLTSQTSGSAGAVTMQLERNRGTQQRFSRVARAECSRGFQATELIAGDSVA